MLLQLDRFSRNRGEGRYHIYARMALFLRHAAVSLTIAEMVRSH
ncbi:hypothetical protein ABIB82_005661 [Bradyrhizobium sp. i1.8.4]